jgi:hypothetical protein
MDPRFQYISAPPYGIPHHLTAFLTTLRHSLATLRHSLGGGNLDPLP